MKLKDITAMKFDTLTFVWTGKDGEAVQPMNPGATVVAVKGLKMDKPFGNAFTKFAEKFGLIRKDGQKAGVASDLLEDAIESAKRSALFGVIYDFEWSMSSILNSDYFDDAAKRDAVNNCLDTLVESITGLAGDLLAEKMQKISDAIKSGKRHNKEDLADIQTTHDGLGEAIKTLTSAHEATSRLLKDGAAADPAPANDGAVKTKPGATALISQENDEVDEATRKALGSEIVAGVTEALKGGFAEMTDAIKSLKPAETAAPAAVVVPGKTDEPADASKALADAVKVAVAEGVAAIKTSTDDAVKAVKETTDGIIDAARKTTAPGGHTTEPEVAANAEGNKATVDAARKTGTIRGALGVLLEAKPKTEA